MCVGYSRGDIKWVISLNNRKVIRTEGKTQCINISWNHGLGKHPETISKGLMEKPDLMDLAK